MKRIHAIVGGALLALTTIPAHAQTQPAEPRLTMDSGFYLGGGAGRVRGSFACVSTCDQRDMTWQGYVGYQFNRYFAVEGGYSDFGSIESSGTIFGGTSTHRVDTTAWEAAVMGIAPFTDKISAYVKIGMFRYKSDATTTGIVAGSSSARDTEFTVGLGLQYAITPHLGARIEWQRYNDVGSGAPGVDKDDLTVWRLTGRYKF